MAKSSVEADTKPTSDGQEMESEHSEPELTLRSGLALAGAALSYFVTVGFLNAYGVFQEYYTTDVLRDLSEFQISWLGSFAIFCIFFFAPAAGLLADKYGPTLPMACGAIAALLALFMTSLATRYYQFFLAQGLLLGAGMSFVAIPASGVCPRYFRRNRALASGVSVAGSSLGGVLWPVACDQLLHNDGLNFDWTIRIVAFVMMPLYAVVLLTVRPPVKKSTQPAADTSESDHSSENKTQGDRSALRKDITKPPFILLCSGLFLAYLGFFSPFFYISTYATHLGMSQSLAFYLVSMVNGASLFGRIIPGFVADRFGKFNLLILSSFSAGIIAFCWTKATSVAGLVVWGLAYGFASGGIMSLQLACATTLVNENAAGAAVGAAMGFTSLAGLFGTPISGELVKHGYFALSAWSAAMLLAGAAVVTCSRLYQNGNLTARL